MSDQLTAAQRVAAEEQALKLVVDKLRGRVVVALNLVAYHLDLLVELLLGVAAVEHDVGEQVYGAGHVVAQRGRIIHGVFLCREGVEVAPHALQAVEYVPGAAARGALEGGVLAEVGHALLARQLVARAGSYGIAAVNDRRGRRKVDDAQPRGQRKCVVFHNSGKGSEIN